MPCLPYYSALRRHTACLPAALAVLLVLTGTTPGWAQSRRRLERQKRENERRIKETNRILSDVSQKKEATLGQLSALENRIEEQTRRISTTSSELLLLEQELEGKATRTRALAQDLAKLKVEYAALVYAASKAQSPDGWLFVFAAESFNQFFARLNHLRYYGVERRAQAKRIEGARKRLLGEQQVLRKKLDEKTLVLTSYTLQKKELDGLQTEKSRLLERLAGKEERLRQELARREEADRKLENLIGDMIRREMRRAEEARRTEARRPSRGNTAAEPASKGADLEAIPSSPEAMRLSASFAENKGRLGWPVEQGFISGRFGKQPHPILKGIIVENLGINIQTKAGEGVVAVAPGEVGFVATIPGVEGKIVSLLHGNYVTVYSNLGSVSVKPGEKVKARERIGSVATDREGVSELQFQLWRGADRLNPESWLVGR